MLKVLYFNGMFLFIVQDARDCKIRRLHLCYGIRHPQRVFRYDLKQFYDEVSVLKLWKILSAISSHDSQFHFGIDW